MSCDQLITAEEKADEEQRTAMLQAFGDEMQRSFAERREIVRAQVEALGASPELVADSLASFDRKDQAIMEEFFYKAAADLGLTLEKVTRH